MKRSFKNTLIIEWLSTSINKSLQAFGILLPLYNIPVICELSALIWLRDQIPNEIPFLVDLAGS